MATLAQAFTGVFAALLATSALPASSIAQSRLNGPQSCFDTLQYGRSPEIACQFPIRPQGRDLDDLVAATGGYLRTVHCVVDIRIARSAVLAAVANPDHQFIAPAQPVTCDIEANYKGDQITRHKITATFAPRLTFRAGMAVEATPELNLGPETSRVISWPVEAYVNSGAAIREGMIKITNAWVQHLRNAPRTVR